MDIVIAAVGTLIGSAVTWFCSWWYYKRAGDELRVAANRLTRVTESIVAVIGGAGRPFELIRDADGRILKVAIAVDGRDAANLDDLGRVG